LLALSKAPYLYGRYNDGDNIIFKEQDYISPNDSVLFSELMKMEEVRKCAYFLKLSCKSDSIDIPEISKILQGKFPRPEIKLSHAPIVNLVGDLTKLYWSTQNCTFVKINGKLVENYIKGEEEYELKESNKYRIEYGNELEALLYEHRIICKKKPLISVFEAKKSNIKRYEAAELTWSAKHYGKLFIKYDTTKIEVTGKTSISLSNLSSKTKVVLEAHATFTDFYVQSEVLITVFNPIILKVIQDKKITYPNHPVKLVIYSENAEKLILMPEHKDITGKNELTIFPQSFLEYEIVAQNKLYSKKTFVTISTIPYPSFSNKLVAIPRIQVNVQTPNIQRFSYEKQSLTPFEKRTLEISKYFDFISPFLLYKEASPIISRIKKYIIIRLYLPSKIK
jgi:hypothetical protein